IINFSKELGEPKPEEKTLEQLIEDEIRREIKNNSPPVETTIPLMLSPLNPVYLLYDSNFDSPNQVEWYSFLEFGTVEVEVDEFASDADDVIDEVNWQSKIKQKKNKPLSIRCYSDKASNTYLQESNAQLDPWGYITKVLETEGLPVSDLFDYFYEE
ncbi:31595_t:CDS:2, partial [Gigaspora margarita]